MGVMCLVAWVLYFTNKIRSSWKCRVEEKIVTLLSMSLIILGLHFKSEMGDYFEEVYTWYNRSGPVNNISGFLMMEIHNL